MELPSVAHGSDAPSVPARGPPIGAGIAADDVGAQRSAVGQHQRPLCAGDDVAVGEDEVVGREDDAGPAAAIRLDLHNRGPDGFDGANHCTRIGVEQIVITGEIREHESMVLIQLAPEITRSGG